MQFSLKSLLLLTTVVALLAFLGKQLGEMDELGEILFWILIPLAIAVAGMAGGYLSATRSQTQPSGRYWAFLFSAPNWIFWGVIRTTFYLTSRSLALDWIDFHHLSLCDGISSFSQNYGFDVLAILFQLAIIRTAATQPAAKVILTGVAIALFWIFVICLALLSLAYGTIPSDSLP